jgi:hypothetical protein
VIIFNIISLGGGVSNCGRASARTGTAYRRSSTLRTNTGQTSRAPTNASDGKREGKTRNSVISRVTIGVVSSERAIAEE